LYSNPCVLLDKPGGSLDCDVRGDPRGLETIWMGPPIRIVTRCISAWPISGLAPETLSCARENQVSWEGDDFDRFRLLGGPRAGEYLI